MRPEPPILAAESVSMRFGGLMALGGVSLRMVRGSITAVIGPNGAGKTTLFNCITGFYRPTAGRIVLHPPPVPGEPPGEGVVLNRLPIHRIARLGVARTYQNIRLFPRMTVLENLLVAQHQRVRRGLLAGVFRTPAFRRAEARALERGWYWLRVTGLERLANHEAGTLPYGQQRRLEVARAMAGEPRLICLDEPAAGLNHRETGELNELILSLKQAHGLSVLLIEHHMGVVMNISDHVVVLDHGEVISDGPPAQVRADPLVIRAYLGEDHETPLEHRHPV